MNKQQVTTKWQSNMSFTTIVPPGVSIAMDASIESGGNGHDARPKSLMLAALAGCSGMDIAMLLKKMRATVENFEIIVVGSLTNVDPRIYDKVNITYRFFDKKFKRSKIEKAVKLSEENLCGVMEMFRKFAELKIDIDFVEL